VRGSCRHGNEPSGSLIEERLSAFMVDPASCTYNGQMQFAGPVAFRCPVTCRVFRKYL
jgi:hypothetical protein